jgi:hypothetical protein
VGGKSRSRDSRKGVAMNVRFWEYVNHDWVKLTLKPQQEMRWHRGAYTDEGWESETCDWTFDGEYVRHNSLRRSLDCDGRFDRYGEFECRLDQLHSRGLADSIYGDDRTEFEKTVTLPAWQEVSCGQRDYSAEAMGY